MCELLDQRIKEERAEGQAEGRAEGRVEERKDLAKKMILKQQFEPEMIAELCELTVDEVNEIKRQLSA